MNGHWQSYMLIVLAGIGLIGWVMPAGITRAVADTLYCSITSANCSTLYCTSNGGQGIGSNCNSSPTIPCKDYSQAKKTTAQSITSTSFTTYTSTGASWASWDGHTDNLACIGAQANAFGIFFCTASFYFTTNTTSVIASFQLTDIGGAVQSGSSATFQAQPAAANQAEMGSIAWQAQSVNSVSAPNIALQGKVSGSNMLLSVKTAAIWCISEGGGDFGTGSGGVG